MRFNCESREVKHARLSDWHRWFAWHPVRVGPSDCRWLEYVERKGTLHVGWDMSCFWTWEYRLPQPPTLTLPLF